MRSTMAQPLVPQAGSLGASMRTATTLASARCAPPGRSVGGTMDTVNAVLAMQQAAGNHAVSRILKCRAASVLARCAGTCRCGGACRGDPWRAVDRDPREPISRATNRDRAHTPRATLQREPEAGTAVTGSSSADASSSAGDRLTSPRFVGEPLLEACFENRARMAVGQRDSATHQPVSKVQQALVDLGFDLGRSGPNADGVDGVFGSETAEAVKALKRRDGLRFEQFGDVGPGTMHRLDELFPPGPPTPSCGDGAVDETRDPLPAAPPFNFEIVSQAEFLERFKGRSFSPSGTPLGASEPSFERFPFKTFPGVDQSIPVSVRVIPTDDGCFKCAAEWTLPVAWRSLILAGPIVLDESKRLFAARTGDVSGCPETPFPRLLDVRELVSPDVLPFILAAEAEHYLDFLRAFRIVGGRYLANVLRLSPDRTHLRTRDPGACEDKVNAFLLDAHGPFAGDALIRVMLFGGRVTKMYTSLMQDDFEVLYDAPDRDRFPDGPHRAHPHPPWGREPIHPNIDRDINPFGCNAYARKLTPSSFRGIPGAASEVLIKDLDIPKRQPWHVM
jgi:Putative peptidoglycan binding domain